MNYTALYRKFRPKKFEDIVGQEHITRTLRNQIISNRVGHAYLFNGTRGTGKTSAAKILARAVNCLNPKDGEPCNECEICKAALSGALTDIVEMDAASNNSVDDIRIIRDEVNFLPTLAKYRVYIIDEVHMLSTGAFNALLKTLEEPPEYIIIILITANENKLLNTIKSRCLKISFNNLEESDLISYINIEQGMQVPSENLLKMCNGSIGKLMKVNENLEEYNAVESTTNNFLNGKIPNVVKMLSQFEILYKSKEIINDLLDYMIVIIYEYINKSKDYRAKFLNLIAIIEDTKNRIVLNNNYDMCIDNLLLKMWEETVEK